MAEKQQESPLVNFMKKQAGNKTSKQVGAKKSTASLKNSESEKDKDKKKEGDEGEEEMTEEEKLEEAKKASRNKAGERDQTEMFKKLIMESIVKYVLLITLLVTLAIGVIKLGPVAAEFLHGLFFKVVVGG